MSKFVERPVFEMSLFSPYFFRQFVRPRLYKMHGNDPEIVHEHALEAMNRYGDILAYHSDMFYFPELEIEINGRRTMPFGMAAGFDKNADVLGPLSYIFGFQKPGTIVVPQRSGNDPIRVVPDDANEDLYNAQGFPSEGVDYAQKRLIEYRSNVGRGTVYASICGIPSDTGDVEADLENARRETEELLTRLEPLVDGFEWNPFSPNTRTLTKLRTPAAFKDYAELIRGHAIGKLRLVKMGPYEPEERRSWLELVEAWLDGGGDGVTAVNTYMVPKENVPSGEWGYPSAGKSGRSLRPYRTRAVRDVRRAFPDAIIFATGGIYDGDDAFAAFAEGADAVEGYTPYTYYGLGLARKIMKGVSRNLRKHGYGSLEELREESKMTA